MSIYQYPWTEDNFLEIRFLIVPVCVGGTETVYKCVGWGQSSHLTRANAAIRTNGADTIICHYPALTFVGFHWDPALLSEQWYIDTDTYGLWVTDIGMTFVKMFNYKQSCLSVFTSAKWLSSPLLSERFNKNNFYCTQIFILGHDYSYKSDISELWPVWVLSMTVWQTY